MPEGLDTAGLLSGLLGLGTTIAGQIPRFGAGPAEGQLGQIAQQGGAGAAAVRSGANQAARNALSIAGSGTGATRGLQLRTALREAERMRQGNLDRASAIAAQEQQQALGQLEAIRQRRVNAIAQTAAAAGQGLAGLGGVLSTAAGGQAQAPQPAGAAMPAKQAPQAQQGLAQGLSAPPQEAAQAPPVSPLAAPQMALLLQQLLGQMTGTPGAEAQAATPDPSMQRFNRVTAPLGQLGF